MFPNCQLYTAMYTSIYTHTPEMFTQSKVMYTSVTHSASSFSHFDY